MLCNVHNSGPNVVCHYLAFPMYCRNVHNHDHHHIVHEIFSVVQIVYSMHSSQGLCGQLQKYGPVQFSGSRPTGLSCKIAISRDCISLIINRVAHKVKVVSDNVAIIILDWERVFSVNLIRAYFLTYIA